MVKISDSSYENEIQVVDRTFNQNSKNNNFLAREALISGGGRAGEFRENGQKQGTYCYAN